MKIIVCVKQVPDTNEIKINPETGTLIREGVPSILNPDDANALEQALQVKDANPGTEVTVITMGPPQAKEMLQECVAMGADEAILLSDRALGGSDTWLLPTPLPQAFARRGILTFYLQADRPSTAILHRWGRRLPRNWGFLRLHT